MTKPKFWANLKTQIVTKLKLWRRKKLILWQNSNYFIVTKIRQSNCDKTQLKLWQNLKTQISTNLRKSNCDKSQNIKLGQDSNSKKLIYIYKICIYILTANFFHFFPLHKKTCVTKQVVHQKPFFSKQIVIKKKMN